MDRYPRLVRALPLLSLFWLAYAALGAGCALGGGDDERGLVIVEPRDGARVSSSAVRVAGTVRTGARQVRVQGEPVAVSAGEFQTTVELPEGPAHIEVTDGEVSAAVDVFVDLAPPRVTIESPALGAYVEGSELRVRGRVEDVSAVTVTADGEPVALDEQGRFDFARTVPRGAYRVRVVAVDAAGHVGSAFTTAIVGHFAAPHDLVPEAIAVALGDEALEAIADTIAPHISPENVEPVVLAANPVASGFWGEVAATSEAHDRAQVTITPGSDSIAVAIAIPNVRVPFEARLPLGIRIHGTTTATRALVEATVQVSALDGRPLVRIVDSNVVLEGLFIDVSGLWDYVDRTFVTSALEGTIQEGIRTAVETKVPPALEAALEGLPLSYDIELAGYTARLAGEVAELRATEAGLRAVLDFGVNPLGLPGSVDAPGPLLLGLPGAPGGNAFRGVEGAMSLDLLNAALFAAWRVGGLSHSFAELHEPSGRLVDAAVLGLLLPIEGPARDAPLAVNVEAVLPPVVRPTDDGVEIHAADVRIDLIAQTGGEGTRLLTVSAGVRATVRPFVAEDGIGLSVMNVEVSIDGLEDIPGLPPAERLDEMLGELLAPLLEPFTELRGFAIPSFYGLTLVPEDASVYQGYVVFEANLQ